MNEENKDGSDRKPSATASCDPTNTAYPADEGADLSYDTLFALIAEHARRTAEESQQTIENAGVRAGEIIGYRVWSLETGDNIMSPFGKGYKGLLKSVVWPYIWTPSLVEKVDYVHPHQGQGFHAFKDIKQAEKEFLHYATNYDDTLVFGEVYMWGEVIEHELGYRSEYAKIKKLYRVVEPVDFLWDKILRLCRRLMGKKSKIQELRERYNLLD